MEGFAGYLVPLPKKYRVALVASMGEFGGWFLVSTRERQELPTKRQEMRALKFLLKIGVLEEDLEVFPEWAPHLQWESGTAFIVKCKEDEQLLNVVAEGLTADDSLEGLEDLERLYE